MPLLSSIQSVMEQHNGIISSAQANEFGISNERLRLLVESGVLERVSFGVYSLPDEITDLMYVTQLRRPKIIYSHETALYLHDLTDRDPLRYSVTVPTGYNATRLRKEYFNVYFIKRELHEIGITELTTIFNHKVKAYDLERTLCDCIRNRNQMDISILTDAIKRYVKRKDKDLNALMKMAKMFRVDKPIRSYMEVLL